MTTPKTPERFTLEDHEIKSQLWRKLKAHIEAQIARHQRTNDGELDPIATAKVRGRIAELRALLSIEKAPIVIEN
jgi:hypothetical protein